MIVKLKRTCLRLCKISIYVLIVCSIVFLVSYKRRDAGVELHGQTLDLDISTDFYRLDQVNRKSSSKPTYLQPTDVTSVADVNPMPSLKQTSSRDCSVPQDDAFPLCRSKFKEFKQNWNENCHGKRFNVNASDPCSVLVYLSEVEPWCPRLPWRRDILIPSAISSSQARIQTDITGLMELLKDEDHGWIRMRARASWDEWVEAAEGLAKKENLRGRRRQRVLVYMSSIGYNPFVLKDAFKGGPLGELVQWTDVICSLYILGHDLVITSKNSDIRDGKILSKHQNGCALKEVVQFDRIITDITGATIMSVDLGPTYPSYRCKLLLLDSFGTEAEFNYAYYKPKIRRSSWGDLNINLKQFMTMFPHSPDNQFMGFAVPKKSKTLDPYQHTKKLQGLIYGKSYSYYARKRKYLDILSKYIELHSTISKEDKDIRSTVPDYVINHGIVNNTELVRILQESKVLIGLGFPYEGPAPLDAVANGCFYINPKINPPLNRDNSGFYAGKPTSRKVTSQNPYAEDFIGKPYVYTIDINNETEVENAIKEILASKEIPHLPYEFSHEGMLQRVNAFMKNLDFCTSDHQWPPKTEMKVLTGGIGKSCKDVCFNKGLLCEPSFFHYLNNIKQFKKSGFRCKTYEKQESIYAPSINTVNGTCILQDMPLLYSCVSQDQHTARVCPCRTYQKEQVALF